MGKQYDIYREDLLEDRTALVYVYLMFVFYWTKGLKYNLFYLCVSVIVFLAVLQFIFISYCICKQQIIL